MVQRTDPEAKRTKLETWLRNKLPSAENISVSQMEKTAGGYGSEIHFFDLSWQEGGQVMKEKLVIREEPKAFRVFHTYHTAREFTTIKSLQDSDVPVPKMYWLETDESVLSAPFYIMERVDGEINSFGKFTTKAFDSPFLISRLAVGYVPRRNETWALPLVITEILFPFT